MDISQVRGGAREQFPGATQPVNKAMLNIVPYKGQLSDEEDHSQPNLFKGIRQGQGASSNNKVENKDRGCARRKAGTRRGRHLLLFLDQGTVLINHITLTEVTLHRHEINTV